MRTEPFFLISNPITGSQQTSHACSPCSDTYHESSCQITLLSSRCPCIPDVLTDRVQRLGVFLAAFSDPVAFNEQCGIFHPESFLE